jgi:hypothetical protein
MPNSVLTFKSLLLLFWLMCSMGSDCAPVLSKPINATRKIPQSSSLKAAAPAVVTTAQPPLSSLSVSTKPSASIHPQNLSSPESIRNVSPTENHNVASPRNVEGATVNVVVSVHSFYFVTNKTIEKFKVRI